MLLAVLLVTLLVSQGLALSDGQTAVTGPIDDLIIELLEQFRDSLPEPLPLADLPIDVDDTGFIVHANITDNVLHDLSTFVIDNVHVDPITLKSNLALRVPALSLNCNYFINSNSLVAGLFPLYGSGPCSVALGNLSSSIDADLRYDLSDGQTHIQIDTMDFTLRFDTLDVQLHNLLDSEDLATVIDEFADDFGPLLVDILVNDTRRDYLPAIIDELNTLLWNVTLPLTDKDITAPISGRQALQPVHASRADAGSVILSSSLRHPADGVQSTGLVPAAPPQGISQDINNLSASVDGRVRSRRA